MTDRAVGAPSGHMPDTTGSSSVLWERSANSWTAHLFHSGEEGDELIAGPWAVRAAWRNGALSWINVADSSPAQRWPRRELAASVAVGEGIIELSLRADATRRCWVVEMAQEGDVFICDDGADDPRITGVLLLGDCADATLHVMGLEVH